MLGRTLRWCLGALLIGCSALFAAQDLRSTSARALSLHQSGDLEGAVAAYREALALDPANAEVRANLGVALAALGRYEEAIQEYRQAVAVVSDDRIRLNLALAYLKSDDLTRAAEELEALHQASPDDLRITLLLADCRLRLGEYERVEELLRPVEAAQPDNRAVVYLLGMALVQGGKTAEGQRLVDRLTRGEDSAEAHFLLGAMAFTSGDGLKAVDELSRALDVNPNLPSLRAHYGRALLFTGDAEGAMEAFQKALADNPNEFEANYYLGAILASRGRIDEARPYAERARQLRPQSEPARALVAGLDDPESLPRPEDVSPLDGRLAPDVELRRPGGGALRLSSLRGTPVLLAFGSFTCPQFRHGAPLLNQLHERYGGRVRFLMVYIREAHPAGESLPLPVTVGAGVSLPEARSPEERASHAGVCRERLDIPYEAVLDGMDGEAEKAFFAFPSRAFVIDRDGTVTFSTALDEQRFHLEPLEAALESVVP